MKLYSKVSLLGAVLIVATAFASADTIQLGSYATGGSSLGNANTAMNFAGFSASPVPSSGTASSFFLDPSTVWAPAVPNSTWVGYAMTAGPVGTVNPAMGYYTFTTTFTATGTYGGSIDVLADDTTEVLLDGAVIVPFGALGGNLHCADNPPTCTMQDIVPLSGLSLSGTNTLTFVVRQAGTQPAGGTMNPSGMDFDATLTTVPEPGSLLLLGTGLIASAGAMTRKMRRE